MPRARMRLTAAAALALFVLAASACSPSATSPTPVAHLASLVYERVYASDATVTRAPMMTLTIPQPDDPYHRSRLHGCVLQPEGSNRFSCAAANVYEVPLELDCIVQVHDEALLALEIKAVATRVYVNGKLVARVERFSNGVEVGQFRIDRRGNVS